MSRHLNLLLLVIALLASCVSVCVGQSGVLRLQLNAADWSPRAESSAFSNPLPQLVPTQDGRMYIPANSLWVYGGIDEQDNGLSDVWVTTDGTKTWMQVMSDRTVVDVSRSADCYSHQSGRVYAITGSTGGGGDTRTARIVASNDGVNWEIINEDAGFLPRERPGCTVDSQGAVYMFGGSTRSVDGDTTGPTNDIWRSSDLGATWLKVASNKAWVPRISTDTQTYMSPVFNKDIMYIESGDGGSTTGTPKGYGFQNDVWVSSDSARTWYQLTNRAPFQYRKDAELTIAKNGVLIVSSGDTDTSNANDLWASLDGGYTWGACCTKCGYFPREDHMAILDASGYYYLMGGDLATDDDFSTYSNDVWKSSFSFHDPAAVSQYCNVQVPSAGVGLTCFPDGSGGCTSDSTSGVPGSSSSSGVSGAMIAAIVFGVLVVIIVVALLYRYKTKAPHESLLPSFGGSKSSEGAQAEQFVTGSNTGDQYARY